MVCLLAYKYNYYQQHEAKLIEKQCSDLIDALNVHFWIFYFSMESLECNLDLKIFHENPILGHKNDMSIFHVYPNHDFWYTFNNLSHYVMVLQPQFFELCFKIYQSKWAEIFERELKVRILPRINDVSMLMCPCGLVAFSEGQIPVF